MPQHTTYDVTTIWVLITDADVTAATFQNLTQQDMMITGTNGVTPPAAGAVQMIYGPRQGERNAPLSDLFPGISGANRIWARMQSGTGTVFISHA
jgi:hypothetical protein